MKVRTANSRRLDILGNGRRSSDREVLTALLKQWRQRLGYCSIFAVVPAILASHLPEARSDAASKPEAGVAGRGVRLFERLNMRSSTPALLKRQSEYLLPHQKGSLEIQTPLAGDDDCPGRPIPAGNYTAAAPYTDSGDTTGANDTVTRARYADYCYYYDEVPGSDHIYSFTLTARGANPQIQVSRTSGTYEPLVYILDSRNLDPRFLGCPVGTGIETCGLIVRSGFSGGGTATINSQQMNDLPLNITLHLFVDSARTDASGSGPYTIRIQDVTIDPAGACTSPNPIDCAEFFVRQQYLDFLNRAPDSGGLDYWTSQITSCPQGDQLCVNARRVAVSNAFFFEPEFQQSGGFVYRVYKAAFGLNPTFAQFQPDRAQIVGGANLDQSKTAFALNFVQRTAFVQAYPLTLSASQFVDQLLNVAQQDAGVSLSSLRPTLIGLYDGTNNGRAAILRQLADNQTFIDGDSQTNGEYNKTFVYAEYVGFVRRAPETAGFNFWLDQVNRYPKRDGDAQHAMVCSFITSPEYQLRFGSAVTHTNAECPQ